MMENNQKTTNLIPTERYNYCPKCGREAFAFSSERGMYYVGCLHCGMRNGKLNFFEEEISEELKEVFRKEWNLQCLNCEYEDDALEALGISEGSFFLATHGDNYVVHIAKTFKDVKEYIKRVGDSQAFNIYQLLNGVLECIGSTYLMWLTIEF